jgi:hypothetical protein
MNGVALASPSGEARVLHTREEKVRISSDERPGLDRHAQRRSIARFATLAHSYYPSPGALCATPCNISSTIPGVTWNPIPVHESMVNARCVTDCKGRRGPLCTMGKRWASAPVRRGWCRDARAGAYRSPLRRVNRNPALTQQRGMLATPSPALLRSRGRPSPLHTTDGKSSALPADPSERGGPPPLLGLSPGLCGLGRTVAYFVHRTVMRGGFVDGQISRVVAMEQWNRAFVGGRGPGLGYLKLTGKPPPSPLVVGHCVTVTSFAAGSGSSPPAEASA